VVYGAGGVGGVIGARLFEAGMDVTLIARGEHGRTMRAAGLEFVSPDGVKRLPIPVALHPSEVLLDAETFVLLCVKSQQTQAALQDLVLQAEPDLRISCVQNGVANEALSLRFFKHTYATVVNLPALFLRPGEVVSYAAPHAGILDSGCYPTGVDEAVIQFTDDLTAAGFSARPDGQVMRQKYAKLLMNLNNILHAGLTDFGNSDALRRRIRDEALACYAAAGIDCASKAQVQTRQRDVYQMVSIPGYERSAGSTWQSIQRGTGDIETDYLNGEISMLGRAHGVPTPANDACVVLARDLLRHGQGPGLLNAAEFAQRIESAA